MIESASTFWKQININVIKINPKHPTYPHKIRKVSGNHVAKPPGFPSIADEGTGQMQARGVAQRGQISASETRLVAGSDERPKRWKAIKRAQSTPCQRNKACHKQINQKHVPERRISTASCMFVRRT